MLKSFRQSYRRTNHQQNQMDRVIFKAIDPYLSNPNYLLKSKNHYRHKSQPVEEEYTRNQPSEIVQSFQEVLRKARQKVSHMRLASETSDTWNRPSKQLKLNKFQYNKWYIDPTYRLKAPIDFIKSSTQRIAARGNRSSFDDLKQSFLAERNDTMASHQFKQDPRTTFVKDFTQRDYKNFNLLKEFKRKQTIKKCRTPEIVDLILEANRDRKQKKLYNKSMKTVKQSQQKISDWCLQSTACSNAVSKFVIEESEMVKRDKSRKPTFMKAKKRLTLLQSEYSKIKKNISDSIEEKKDSKDGSRMDRFKLKI